MKRKKKGATPPPTPATPTSAQLPLNTAIDVRREQAKIYREARGGSIESNKAGKLVWMLGEIRRTIETDEVEQQLKELRQAAVAQGLLKK